MLTPELVATSGRVSAVNLITATRIRHVPRQRLGFALSRAPDWLARLADEQGLEPQFKTFNFLHTARWVSLGRFGRSGAGQPGERRSPRWVLFTANFDGDWGPYFGAFMEALAEGVYDLWGPSIDYPGFPEAGTANALRDWLDTRLPRTDHYYAAYPHATTNDVRAAARVHREVCSLAIDLTTRPEEGRSTEVVTRDVGALARDLRHCLGPIERPGWDASPPTVPAGTIRGIVAVFRVLPEHEPALTDTLAALGSGASSFLGRVPGTHFGRIAILHRSRIGRHPTTQLALRSSYLLVSADYDATGPRDRSDSGWFRSLVEVAPDEVAAIWRHCAGFAGVDEPGAFAALARRGRCRVLREFLDYPDESLRSILTALASQRRFVELVQRRSAGGTVSAADVAAFLEQRPSG